MTTKTTSLKKTSVWAGLLPVLSLITVVLTLYSTISRVLLWDILHPFLEHNLNLILNLIFNSDALVRLDIGQINVWVCQFVIVAALILLGIKFRTILTRPFLLTSLPLVALLILTGLSYYWSVSPGFTLSRHRLLLAAALGAVLLGLKYQRTWIRVLLEIFAALLIVGSLVMILKFPIYSTMLDFRGFTQWNGIFSWKMPAATLMGFAVVVFLFRLLDFKKDKWVTRIYGLVFYGLALWLLVKSYSATEQIAVAAVHLVILLGILYLKWGHRLKPVHWWTLGGLALVVILAAWFGRDFLFGLVGREVTFTDRLPLWSSLGPAIQDRLWFGYGFGDAFWKNLDYYQPIWDLFAWSPVFAHNGYVEALIDNGLVGLALWVVFLLQTAFLSLRYFVHQHELPALIFFSWFIFVAVMNIGNNHLGSYETFTWFLLVLALAVPLCELLDRKTSPAVEPRKVAGKKASKKR